MSALNMQIISLMFAMRVAALLPTALFSLQSLLFPMPSEQTLLEKWLSCLSPFHLCWFNVRAAVLSRRFRSWGWVAFISFYLLERALFLFQFWLLFVDSDSEVVYFLEEFWILVVFAFDLGFLLILVALACLYCLLQAYLEVLPHPVELINWGIFVLLIDSALGISWFLTFLK